MASRTGQHLPRQHLPHHGRFPRFPRAGSICRTTDGSLGAFAAPRTVPSASGRRQHLPHHEHLPHHGRFPRTTDGSLRLRAGSICRTTDGSLLFAAPRTVPSDGSLGGGPRTVPSASGRRQHLPHHEHLPHHGRFPPYHGRFPRFPPGQHLPHHGRFPRGGSLLSGRFPRGSICRTTDGSLGGGFPRRTTDGSLRRVPSAAFAAPRTVPSVRFPRLVPSRSAFAAPRTVPSGAAFAAPRTVPSRQHLPHHGRFPRADGSLGEAGSLGSICRTTDGSLRLGSLPVSICRTTDGSLARDSICRTTDGSLPVQRVTAAPFPLELRLHAALAVPRTVPSSFPLELRLHAALAVPRTVPSRAGHRGGGGRSARRASGRSNVGRNRRRRESRRPFPRHRRQRHAGHAPRSIAGRGRRRPFRR